MIRSGALHPFLNMALDEALRPAPPVLRLYAFAPAGLTLGYFQRASDFDAVRLAALGAVAVRRVTGGAAILHADDLTFSLVARRDHPFFAGTVPESYHRIHGLVARGLARLGVAADPRGARPARSDSARRGEAVCFHEATAFDLVAAGRKLVGSAQRRFPDRVLHHGSIPLGRNALAGEAASLEALLGRKPPREEVEDALLTAFAEEAGVALAPGATTPEEWRDAERLVDEKYGRDEWNRRR